MPDPLRMPALRVGTEIAPEKGALETPALLTSRVAPARRVVPRAAAGRPSKPTTLPVARTVPSLMVTPPVKVLLPDRIKSPLPALVTPPVPLARTEEIVREFALFEPPVTMKSSWLAVDVVTLKAPLMIEAPPALSCRIPPTAVAEPEVTVRLPPRVRLAPEVRRMLFAARTPEVCAVESR